MTVKIKEVKRDKIVVELGGKTIEIKTKDIMKLLKDREFAKKVEMLCKKMLEEMKKEEKKSDQPNK